MDPLRLSGFTGRKRSATLLGHLTDVPFFVNENIGQKILSKDLENIVKKVASGKTLTSAERSLVEKAYGTSGDVKFAKTIVELSEILGVSRKTIVRLRKLKGSPKPCSDGRHNVAKWRDFVRKHDLKEPDSPEDEELKTRKLLAEVKQAEIKPEHYHKKGALAAPRQPDRVNFFKESDISQFYIVQGRKYDPKELDIIEKQVNVPIKRAIQRKYYTPEKKAILDTLRKQKKVKEFREIAEKIKQDIAFDWNANPNKIYMTEEKRNAYINEGGIHHLDKEYTVFGEVIEGFEVIDKIAALPTDGNDRPITDVRIKVRILSE